MSHPTTRKEIPVSEIDYVGANDITSVIERALHDAKESVTRAALQLEDYDQDDVPYAVPNEVMVAYLESKGITPGYLDEILLELTNVRARIVRLGRDTILAGTYYDPSV